MRMRTLGLFVVVLLVVAACGTEEGGEATTVPTDATTTTADSGQEEDPTTSTAPPDDDATTTTAASTDGIHVADTDLGPILVDPDGFTLYIFTVDSGGESDCYDACAELWPPVPADTPISADLDAAMFGSTERTDGSQQLTVNGMPLYLYTPDTSPGDTIGQGFNDVWFVVDADGNMVTSAEASDGDQRTPAGDYDYDY